MARKTLFITGASSGIGAATARAAVANGWYVGLFARSEDKVRALAAELEPHAVSLSGDATDLAAQETALAELAKQFGSVEAAFANAGMGLSTTGVTEGDPEEWRSLIDVNVMAVLYTVRAAWPHLQCTKGHLLMTGSAAGRRHVKESIYGATKWFVHGLAGNLAEAMRDWDGRCTVVAPGMVNTDFFDDDMPDKLQPEDVADAVMLTLDAEPRCAVREIYMMPND